MKLAVIKQQASRALDHLLEADGLDPVIRLRAIDLRDKLSKRPLNEILDMVPGDTVAEQARRCHVSRQAFHAWVKGTLPNYKQAMLIARVTGCTIAEIRGSSLPVSPAPSRATRIR